MIPFDHLGTIQLLCTLAATTFAYFALSSLTIGRRLPNMPPGPPTLPIIGNLLDLPKGKLHLTFTAWSKKYGDVMSLRILHQTLIIIQSPTLVKELIDKRASASCNRPKSTIADMITPNGMNMGTSRYTTETWKAMRRASAQLLGNENMRKIVPFQRAEAAQFMWELVHQPDKWPHHIRRYTTSLILGLVYGLRGPTLQSPNVADFMDVHPQFLNALEFGTMPPVDLFPILTYVPERYANWKRIAKKVRFLHERLYDNILATVEKRVANGQGIGAFMEELLTKGPAVGLLTRDHLMHLGGVLMEGSDTSSSFLQVFIHALTVYKNVLKKAREEVDSIVGSDRTPDEHDLPKLKYVRAIIDECARFRPVGPLAIPHEMMEDTVVDGILYPKDAVIFTNICIAIHFPSLYLYQIIPQLDGMFHDERYFDRPEEFIPERFLKHPLGVKDGVEDDPARHPNMQFGGGRRICPGITFTRTSMELNAANLIWGFDFLPAIDPKTGEEVYPDLDNYTPGITATPIVCPLRIRPRSDHHKEIIERQFQASGDILAHYEYDIAPVDKEFNAKYRDI
ncbi:hypothetical protein AMATHDRAFT_45749 [Amanita thiersii Skay4041]|uniref:Cytochrome P450 n=1 Tax=Amanita thiersii Skay4041 TaxID=703135 RepID=A0A2A9NXJ1_9AGAR|nr:hypothetical protein AMATHDRAFT_45749 [Amanita thiersii Skay4041]